MNKLALKIKPKLVSLYFVIKSTKNWITALKIRYLSNPRALIHFRNGYQMEVGSDNWYQYILHTHLFSRLPSAALMQESLEFEFKKKKLKMYFGSYGFDTIFEIFAFDPYKDFLRKLSIEGRTVVDIGAAFGDTAIYFLLNGAKNVIGIEAFPGYHRIAEKNIEVNGYADRCKILLCAVGGKQGSVVIDDAAKDMYGAGLDSPISGVSVDVITLENIVSDYDIKDALLKLDTEGFEYEILLGSSIGTIRNFSQMLIEYHYGYEKIEEFLTQCGYSFYHTGPTHVYVPFLNDEDKRNMMTGHIVAERID
jgi:FkbM family methyltransferase